MIKDAEYIEATLRKLAEVIDKIIHMVNCKIEIIGSWIWVTGDIKPYKDILKFVDFRWCQKKQMWAYHKEPY